MDIKTCDLPSILAVFSEIGTFNVSKCRDNAVEYQLSLVTAEMSGKCQMNRIVVVFIPLNATHPIAFDPLFRYYYFKSNQRG